MSEEKDYDFEQLDEAHKLKAVVFILHLGQKRVLIQKDRRGKIDSVSAECIIKTLDMRFDGSANPVKLSRRFKVLNDRILEKAYEECEKTHSSV